MINIGHKLIICVNYLAFDTFKKKLSNIYLKRRKKRLRKQSYFLKPYWKYDFKPEFSLGSVN